MQEDFRKAIEKIIEVLEIEQKFIDDEFTKDLENSVTGKTSWTPIHYSHESGRLSEVIRLVEVLKQVAIAPSPEESINNIINYNKEDN